MASIDIEHAHSLAPTKARQAVQDVAEKLASKFGVDYRWEGDVMHFTRSGIDGHIELVPQALHVRAQLGFLFGAMKGPIESEIRRVLQERFS